MARIGMVVSRTDLDAPAAEHFGKAKWLVVVEAPDRCEFIKNTGLDGRSVAHELASRGCTDVVARHMGPGAYEHVTAAGMKAWAADESVTVRVVAERLAGGALRPLAPSNGGHEHAHVHHR
jgi:predicted Fe-Mo cluster-binding NifX family protein